MTTTISYESRGHVGTLTLNNPDKHNSLGRQEFELIHAALATVASEPDTRVLVLTGAGRKTFCAGASLVEMKSGAISGEDYQAMTDAFAALSIPTICAVNGDVFGGGVELALSCDFRIGMEGITMRVPAASIGLCYPPRGIERFVEKLGVTMAKRVLVAAETFTADEMFQAGLLDHLVMPTQLDETVAGYAGRLAGLAPLAVTAMKAIIQQVGKPGVNQDEIARLSQRCAESADLEEGFAAIAEKRQPLFRGS